MAVCRSMFQIIGVNFRVRAKFGLHLMERLATKELRTAQLSAFNLVKAERFSKKWMSMSKEFCKATLICKPEAIIQTPRSMGETV